MKALFCVALSLLLLLTFSCRSASVYADTAHPYADDDHDFVRPVPPALRDSEPRLTGMVFDGTTNQSLSGAVVTVTGRSAISDESGRYSIDGLRPGSYAATVTKPAYISRTERITIRDDTPNVLNFSLELKK